jgi:chromosome segregation ATPase
MTNKKLAVLALGVVALVLLTTAGCTSKKHIATIEDQKARLDQANSRINELQQGNEALDKSLQETKGTLGGARKENLQLAANVASLKDQITALEGTKAELDKALAAGKETEASYQKKVRGLNGLIGGLKKKVADAEALIASKDAEISALKTSEASLKAAADEQARKMAALTTEKDNLSATLDKTVASKKSTTLILAVLLGLAVLLAIVGFVRGRKGPAAV